MFEAEFRQGFAEHNLVRHHDLSMRDGAGRLQEVRLACAADDAGELFKPAPGANDQQGVAQVQRRVLGGGENGLLPGAPDARDDDACLPSSRDLSDRDALEVLVLHDDIEAPERFDAALLFRAKELGFAHGIDAKDRARDEQRTDDADDADRIADRISERRDGGLAGGKIADGGEGLLGGAERGRVRGRAGEQAEGRKEIVAVHPRAQSGDARAEQDDGGSHGVQAQAMTSQ